MFSKMTYRTQMLMVAGLATVVLWLGIVAVAFQFMIKTSVRQKTQTIAQNTGLAARLLSQGLLRDAGVQKQENRVFIVRPDGSKLPIEQSMPVEELTKHGAQIIFLDSNGGVIWPEQTVLINKKRLAGASDGQKLYEFDVNGKHYAGAQEQLDGFSVLLGYPEPEIPLLSIILGNLGFLLVGMVVIFGAMWVASLPIRRITGETAGAMWSLAEGDLGVSMEEKGLVEERMFRRQFNKAVNKLRGFMSRVNQLAKDVYAAVDQSASAAEQTGKSIQQQQEKVEAGSAALEEVSASVEEVAVSVQSATDLSSEARSLAAEGEKSVESVSEKADSTRKAMERLVEEVGRLEQVAGEINTALNLINDISEETNLLSLNAAIEASRAGEAGRGFAVVADEIRNLAERSMTSARQVKQVVEGITSSLKDVVAGIKQGADLVQDLSGDVQGMRMTFHLIVNSVDQVADKMLTVSTATEEQTQVIAELSAQMTEITNSGQEIAAASQQLSRASEEIKSRMEELRNMLDQFMGLDQ